jgi:hypothetical protein
VNEARLFGERDEHLRRHVAVLGSFQRSSASAPTIVRSLTRSTGW